MQPDETPGHTGKPVAHKHALAFIFLTVTLDSIGIGLILPVIPKLIESLTGGGLAEAAQWGGAMAFVYALMQFLCNPIIGSISDAYGRRMVLLLSLAALCVDYVLMALAPTIALLFVGRLLAGVFGATFSTANAYIADVTPKSERAAKFGLLGAGFGLGFIIGPAIGGFLGEISPRAPFVAAALFAAANFAYGALVLPETLAPENRRPFEWRRSNPFGAARSIGRFPMLTGLLIALLVYNIAHYVYPAVWAYFTLEAFGWSTVEVGYSLAFVGIAFVVAQGLLIRPIIKRFGTDKTAIYTLVLNVVALLAFMLVTEGWMIYLIIPFTAFGAITGPAMTGILSSEVPANMQGELQGIVASISSLSTVVSPVLMTQIFAAFSGISPIVEFPAAPFLAASMLMLGALLITVSSLRSRGTVRTG